jgi:hypothetical protein
VADLRRKWSTIPKQQHFKISRHAYPRGGFLFRLLTALSTRPRARAFRSRRFIVNANHRATGIFGSKVKLLYFV